MDKQSPAHRLLRQKIDQLLVETPAAAEALIAHRMACIGCAFDRFHTLGQALDIYGVEPEVFLQRLTKLNEREEIDDEESKMNEGEPHA